MRVLLPGMDGGDRRALSDVEEGGRDTGECEAVNGEALPATTVSQSVFAVDPGPIESGFCWFDGRIINAGTVDNEVLYGQIRTNVFGMKTAYVFEKIRSYGLPVGSSTFETCFWTGRMFEAAVTITSMGAPVARIEFPDVKKHLCPGAKGKDADFRKALYRRFGGEVAAKGTKVAPGPLRGVSGHAWSALALAVTWWDRAKGTRDLSAHNAQMRLDVIPY